VRFCTLDALDGARVRDRIAGVHIGTRTVHGRSFVPNCTLTGAR
jgi:hypothetical protein